MKLRTYFFALSLLVAPIVSWGQGAPPEPPLPIQSSNMNHYKTHRLINNFHQLGTGLPESFIIDTKDIADYLENATDDFIYLHIYFAMDPTGGEHLQLVLVPTVEYTKDDDYILEHDQFFADVFVPNYYQGGPGFCYITDRLDADGVTQTGPCDITAGSCLQSKSTVKPWIKKFQDANTQVDNHQQSFTISANLLRNFLSKNDAPFFQIYIGQDPDLQAGTKEKYTLLFVGLNKDGTHIRLTGGAFSTYTSAYEACVPCPICGVDADTALDDENQATLPEIRYYRKRARDIFKDFKKK